MVRSLALVALLGLASVRAARAAPLRLFDESPIPILLSPWATPVETFAAAELGRYLSAMTGRPFAAATAGTQLPAKALLIGPEFAAGFADSFRPERFGDEGFLLKRSGGRVLIAGAGTRGTLYAVYGFLEQFGCGWYAPNFAFYGAAGGEHIPHLAMPEIGELEVAEKPSFRWRKKYVEEGQTHDLPSLLALVDWMGKARLNVLDCPADYQGEGHTKWDNWRQALIPELRKRGILIEVGGHGYQNFLPTARYFDRHPDWFGMDEGKRSADPRVVFSTANPAAVAAFIGNIRLYLEAHPEIDIFDCWPPDSERWSEAPEDVALGTPAERQIKLLNHLAADLNGTWPKLRVQFVAYSHYIDPPLTVHPSSNVMMEFCPINRSFQGPIFDEKFPENLDYFTKLKGWLAGPMDPGSVTLYTYITKYQWRSLPILIPHLIALETKRYAQMGLGGTANYSEPGAWASLELDHYFLARFSWNAQRDPDTELAAYAHGRFGSAWESALAYLKLVEAVVPNAVVIPGTHLEPRSEQRYAVQFRRAAALLQSARRSAGDDQAALALVEKLEGARRYAENEIQLRQAFMEAGTVWRRDQLTKLQALMDERRKIIESNRTQGLMVVDARTW